MFIAKANCRNRSLARQLVIVVVTVIATQNECSEKIAHPVCVPFTPLTHNNAPWVTILPPVYYAAWLSASGFPCSLHSNQSKVNSRLWKLKREIGRISGTKDKGNSRECMRNQRDKGGLYPMAHGRWVTQTKITNSTTSLRLICCTKRPSGRVPHKIKRLVRSNNSATCCGRVVNILLVVFLPFRPISFFHYLSIRMYGRTFSVLSKAMQWRSYLADWLNG